MREARRKKNNQTNKQVKTTEDYATAIMEIQNNNINN